MTSFLDTLAMEVSEWAETQSDRKTWCWAHSNDHDNFVAFLDKDNVVTYCQWLQRRKELINEPDDADAPEWAKWKAQDSDGQWAWYEHRPAQSGNHWNIFCEGVVLYAGEGEVPAGHDWRKTLKEVKRETKVGAEEITDPIDSEIIRTIAMIRVETNEYVRFSLVDHLDVLLEMSRQQAGTDTNVGTKTLDQHRAEFEEWVTSFDGHDDFTNMGADGFYVEFTTQRAWQAWKAALGIAE